MVSRGVVLFVGTLSDVLVIAYTRHCSLGGSQALAPNVV
jgi:hypothetical protein